MNVKSIESLADEMEVLAKGKEIAIKNMSTGSWQQETVVDLANLQRWVRQIREALK
jgi:hypothetical protein